MHLAYLLRRWRFLRRVIQAHPDTVVKYVKAACVLHNFLISKSKINYCPPDYVDTEIEGSFHPGTWRDENPALGIQQLTNASSNNSSRSAMLIRDQFKDYFVSPAGEIPWQYNIVNRS